MQHEHKLDDNLSLRIDDMPRRHKGKKNGFYDPRYFIDRELSWLAFNERVIEEAEDETTPLLERLKFLGIASSNLDEFFMVRVSGVQEQVEARVQTRNPAGFTPDEHFARVHEMAHRQVQRQYDCYRTQVAPAMARENIHLRNVKDLKGTQRRFVNQYFDREVFPVLTPLGVDSGHPFPHLRNLSLNLAVRLAPPKNARTPQSLFAVVQVPQVLDRLVRLPHSPEGMHEFVLLEDLISNEIHLLFPGIKILEVAAFRVTRDADIDFAEEEADDLLKTIEEELRRRERGSAVRVGVEKKASPELIGLLTSTINLTPMQVYLLDGPMNLSELAQISSLVDRPDLKYQPFTPSLREPMRSEKDIFRAIAHEDILVHHPYESFSPVQDLIEQAARDPNVLAIKQTLYRTSGDSPITRALMEAAENGKQVAALVELKARFDEERNIIWARRMEKAGVHVVYGLVGLKTHAKLALVVRKEKGGIRRYVHLGTGNYNPTTARLYTDLGLLTCDPDVCDDVTELFNLLTGYSRLAEWRKVTVAPMNMREKLMRLIDEEIRKNQQNGKQKPGRIRAKMNSLVDADIIAKLYEASQEGVQIDLLVRGICCLRPGIRDVSENIRVSSIVDRFLEHSRIFIFGQGEDEMVYLSSADWMPRNLDRRVEAFFPIENASLRKRVVQEIFETSIRDNVKRRILQSDGTYVRAQQDKESPLRAQAALLELEEQLRQEQRVEKQPVELLPRPSERPTPDHVPPIRPIIPAARQARAQASELLQHLQRAAEPAKAPEEDKEKKRSSGGSKQAGGTKDAK
jgi:polyphosphate kinase